MSSSCKLVWEIVAIMIVVKKNPSLMPVDDTGSKKGTDHNPPPKYISRFIYFFTNF